MPKITWRSQPAQKPKPKVNELAALFHAYRKERGMNSEQIAERVGCTPGNARCQMCKPGRDWNVGKLMDYCDVLGIPYEDAFAAAVK